MIMNIYYELISIDFASDYLSRYRYEGTVYDNRIVLNILFIKKEYN